MMIVLDRLTFLSNINMLETGETWVNRSGKEAHRALCDGALSSTRACLLLTQPSTLTPFLLTYEVLTTIDN